MNPQILSNIVKFLERVPVNGPEAYAWCEAHLYLQEQIKKATAPTVPGESNAIPPGE